MEAIGSFYTAGSQVVSEPIIVVESSYQKVACYYPILFDVKNGIFNVLECSNKILKIIIEQTFNRCGLDLSYTIYNLNSKIEKKNCLVEKKDGRFAFSIVIVEEGNSLYLLPLIGHKSKTLIIKKFQTHFDDFQEILKIKKTIYSPNKTMSSTFWIDYKTEEIYRWGHGLNDMLTFYLENVFEYKNPYVPKMEKLVLKNKDWFIFETEKKLTLIYKTILAKQKMANLNTLFCFKMYSILYVLFKNYINIPKLYNVINFSYAVTPLDFLNGK